MSQAKWSKRAQLDFARINDFYQDVAPAYADRLGEAALGAARVLAENPRGGMLIEGEIRKWRIMSFEYVLIYRITRTGIEVLRMHHARENWRRRPSA